MKKILVLVLSFLCISNVYAYSAVAIVDADSGRMLYGENFNQKYLIASTTKIMTALVVLNYNDLDNEVKAGDEILEAYGSSIYLKPGEVMSVEDLLYGLMLRSGNDAAVTLAVHTAGSIEGFVKLMNDTAISIGMHDTVFSNPSGLDSESENKSTVYDMCLLMIEAMKNENFRKITSTKKYNVKSNFGEYEWFNKNRLITDYKYATGGKIGYTTKAKHTFVSSATKDGKNLVIATFIDPDRFLTHETLYEKYFKLYEKYNLIDKDNLNVHYKPGYKVYTTSDFSLLLTKEEKKKIKREVELYDNEFSGSGDKVIGNISIVLDSKIIKKLNLYAVVPKEKQLTVLDRIRKFLKW